MASNYIFIVSSIPSSTLTRVFSRILPNPPSGSTYTWDFGDGSENSNVKNPTHVFSEEGIYDVKLTIQLPDDTTEEVVQIVMVSSNSVTQLSGSIYDLIDTYLPTNLVKTFPYKSKQLYIEKWQLYIQPLVNHEIHIAEYNNELKYEALENQLIMELAIYDFLTTVFTNLLQEVSNTSTSVDEETTETSNGNVKKIVTGPSEVEFFDGNATDVDAVTSITKAVSPGGIVDMIYKNICTLALRLEIIIPYCSNPKHVTIPSIQYTPRPNRPLRGPNPKPILNNG